MFLENPFAHFCYAPDNGAASATDPPETEPVATPEAPEPGTETTEEAVDRYAALEAAGYPSDPEQLIATISQMRDQAKQVDTYRNMLWEMQQQRQRQAQAPAAPAAEQKAWQLPWGKAPEGFDPSRISQITAEELDTNPILKQQYLQYMDWQRKGHQALLTDPVNNLLPGFAPHIQQIAMQTVQAYQQQMAQQQHLQGLQQRLAQFVEANRGWTHDPVTGGLTQAGQLWDQAFKQAVQFGIPDPFKHADDTLDATLARLEWENSKAAPPKPEKPANPRLDFLKARNKPGRAGSFVRPNGKRVTQRNKDDVFDDFERALSDVPDEDFRKD